jgi:hypothetical protein
VAKFQDTPLEKGKGSPQDTVLERAPMQHGTKRGCYKQAESEGTEPFFLLTDSWLLLAAEFVEMSDFRFPLNLENQICGSSIVIQPKLAAALGS